MPSDFEDARARTGNHAIIAHMTSRLGILERVIAPARGDFSPDLARHILSLDFPEQDHARYEELSAKVQERSLTQEETAELEEYLTVNDLLMFLQAKARASLARQNPAA